MKSEKVTRAQADAFLDELEALYRKHGLTLAHEDGQGAFIIEHFDESSVKWLRDAHLEGDDA